MKRAEEMHRDKGLTVVWVGFQDRRENIRKFAELHGLNSAGYDEGDKMSEAFGIRYGAGAAFVSAGGMVKARVPKGFSPAALEENIRKILN